HETLGEYRFLAEDGPGGGPRWLFTENETNARRLFDAKNPAAHVKDAFHETVVQANPDAVNPEGTGTRVAAWYRLGVPAGESRTLRLRLRAAAGATGPPFGETFEDTFAARVREADEFYDSVLGTALRAEERAVARQGYAGLLWSKQFYHYIVKEWLEGDPAQPRPPAAGLHGGNADWKPLYCREVLSMPDKWEYPWFAAWDLAFHMVPFAKIDPTFAKSQLLLLLREWYTHPNGQLPAYEWALGDVNPPVHAWAASPVYNLT